MSAEAFAALVHLWDTLKLDKIQQGKRGTGYLPAFVLALARARCAPASAAALERRLAALSAPGPEISGKSLVGVELLPPHMRGQLMSQLHVLCRLRGEAVPLVQSEQLVQYLAGPCDGLLERLYDEWYEEEEAPAPAGSAPSGKGSGGTRKRQLKPPYAGPQRGKKK